MQEIWASVEENPFYEVSNLGRARSIDRYVNNAMGGQSLKRGKILKPGLGSKGYLFIVLSKNSIQKMKYIHRLVAMAFLPKSSFTHVNHKDGNPLNNAVSNLEWCTHQQNVRHAAADGRFRAIHNPRRAKKLTLEKVRQIRRDYSNGATITALCERYGITQAPMRLIVKNKSWAEC